MPQKYVGFGNSSFVIVAFDVVPANYVASIVKPVNAVMCHRLPRDREPPALVLN
jgi:hypothetical protein